MTILNEVLGGKAEEFKKKYPNVAEYIEKYYVIDWEKDKFEFDFEKNDSILSCSVETDHFDSMPHASLHINKDVNWANEKMFQEKNSSAHPSWFGTAEEVSQFLINVFTNKQISETIERWCNDRNIYYYDKNLRQKTIHVDLHEVCGWFIIRGIRGKIFETTTINVVLEYTQFQQDGPFIIYTTYPYVDEDFCKEILINNKRK